MKGVLMTPQKRRAAMVRGICKLSPRIGKLRDQLSKLESAELTLVKMKWAAETEMIEVQIIPIGMTAKKVQVQAKSIEDQVSTMSAEKATELLAILDRRLNNGNSD
jgi:hypothetical protein